MRSLRLDQELDQKLRRAAAAKGVSVSEFIRGAAEARADQVLMADPSHRFADVAGVVRSHGGRARRTGDAFTEALVEDRRQR